MMLPLEKTLRGQLEKTVKDARDLAETAAKSALESLGVGESQAFDHLGSEDKDLRRRLRVHGRQLGDERKPNGSQSLDRLIEEVGYEHWHRMLFARFLAENSLLMYPDPDDPVAVSLEECEELAPDEGAANGWELAARYAARMLPQIFRPESPVFELSLSPEHQQALEKMIEGLATDVFTASDSLGWVYQFWQAKKKDEVNASEVKIGARELPAVTQLFTEPYMVSFLLDNSLGAWWARHRLSESDLQTAKSEEELRKKASIPGVPLEYLRFVNENDGPWQIAAGGFEGWPEKLSEFKALDPCCGSGHFLVSALLMLTPIRMEMEGLDAKSAVDAVLRENLNGLELDRRCVELAAFALAFTAWRYPDAGGYRPLPELSVACSGLSVSVAKEEWKALGLGKKNLSLALEVMHETFQDAPVLGSLLDPARSDAARMLGVTWEELSGAMSSALEQEEGDEEKEAAVVAHGLAKTAILLSRRHHLIFTNVPYLTRGKQCSIMKDFCETYYDESKNDLATVFLDRCLSLCETGGTSCVVLPQNWLFLTSYRKYREKLLKEESWNFIARLGAKGFQTPMWDFNVQLITLTRGITLQNNDLFSDAESPRLLRGVDVSNPKTAEEKSNQLITAELKSVQQQKQLENPDCRLELDHSSDFKLMSEYVSSYQGITTGDNPRFIFHFTEFPRISPSFETFQSTEGASEHFSGSHQVFKWENGDGYLASSKAARIQGMAAWNKRGVAVNQMSDLPATINNGSPWDMNCATLVPNDCNHLAAIWLFCSSPTYCESVRQIDQSLKVTNATLVKIPFDIDFWAREARTYYPNGLPAPYTDDPTQWIFHGHPCGSVIWNETTKLTDHGALRTDETVLHIAVARLLGYQWPAELDPEMELAPQQREWVDRCSNLHSHADQDGIVVIPSVRGEQKAEDRLKNLLAAAYGDTWSTNILDQLLASCGHAGKSLDSWLRDKFFAQHFKLFGHRPFIWHIWDGLSDGFSALVNYHKLDHKNLETLTYTYLGDWITRQQENDRKAGLSGDGEKTAAAKALKQRLELIIESEAPYDIFVRWKPLDQQPVGWNPDLYDGVRLNIRPFMSVPDIKRKGAGILRDKPNIHWKKDRGKDVESAPWFHQFKGERLNDHHLTLAEKKGK